MIFVFIRNGLWARRKDGPELAYRREFIGNLGLAFNVIYKCSTYCRVSLPEGYPGRIIVFDRGDCYGLEGDL